MNIHEYQAKDLLKAYGAPVANGVVAKSADEAIELAKELNGDVFVVKAQIHAGGRGKGGGIKLVKTIEEMHAEADRMLGKPLVTPQTGPKGRVVRSVYVVEDTTIARELYLSLLVDRATGRVPSSPRPKAASISRKWPRRRPRRSRPSTWTRHRASAASMAG
ncbi:MAG: hypothetical protein A49_00960 [Methyloceanibacter sp.]|nr:MAG: hypothetical protein A49_00960 [Methyloceanibacter sp.]